MWFNKRGVRQALMSQLHLATGVGNSSFELYHPYRDLRTRETMDCYVGRRKKSKKNKNRISGYPRRMREEQGILEALRRDIPAKGGFVRVGKEQRVYDLITCIFFYEPMIHFYSSNRAKTMNTNFHACFVLRSYLPAKSPCRQMMIMMMMM